MQVCFGENTEYKKKMPKIKQLEKCKHPNSRKTKALTKQLKKQSAKEKAKLSTNIKHNMLGEKLIWFRDNLNLVQEYCFPSDVEQLILKYLGRFDEELEQIKLKHSIGQRKNRQHANREDIINMTLKREREEFRTCGIEMPNLLNSTQLKQLLNWRGELRYLQNFKLRRFSLQNLKEEKRKAEIMKNNGGKNIDIANKELSSSVDVKQQGNESLPEQEGFDRVGSMDVDS